MPCITVTCRPVSKLVSRGRRRHCRSANAEGKIIVWNPACRAYFRLCTEAEALGQSLDMITPERLRKRHWEGYDKSMATGTTRYGNDVLRVPAVHKDGRSMSIAFTVAMLFDDRSTRSAR